MIVTKENVTSLRGFRDDDDDGPTFGLEPQTVVKPGQYQLAFVRYKTALLYGKAAKVGLKFRIVDLGPYFEKELYRWYNVKRLIGSPGKSGKFRGYSPRPRPLL